MVTPRFITDPISSLSILLPLLPTVADTIRALANQPDHFSSSAGHDSYSAGTPQRWSITMRKSRCNSCTSSAESPETRSDQYVSGGGRSRSTWLETIKLASHILRPQDVILEFVARSVLDDLEKRMRSSNASSKTGCGTADRASVRTTNSRRGQSCMVLAGGGKMNAMTSTARSVQGVNGREASQPHLWCRHMQRREPPAFCSSTNQSFPPISGHDPTPLAYVHA